MATANPLAGAATRSGSSPVSTNGCDEPTRGCRQWPGRRWRLPAARPQGAAPRAGLSPARATAGRSGRQQGQRPREAVLPAQVPPEGSSACRRGGCPRRR
ncbi:hypothetical protein GW17_00052331, partial [Ensete ventricosum]